MDDMFTMLAKISARLDIISTQLDGIQNTLNELPNNLTIVITPEINKLMSAITFEINKKFGELPNEIKNNFLPDIYGKIDQLIDGVGLASKQIEAPLRTSGEIQVATLACVIALNIILIGLISSIIHSMQKDRLEQKKTNDEITNKINETISGFNLHKKQSSNKFYTLDLSDEQDNKSQQDSGENSDAKQRFTLT